MSAIGPERPDVFLSYAREDTAFADRLSAALLQRGKDVWIDVDDIRGGAADWRASVWAGIEAAKVVVLVLTPDLLASAVCGEELERAVALNKRIVPVLRRPVDGLEVPPAVEAPNWIYAREEDGFETSVAKLVAALELDEAWVERHARYTQRTGEWLRSERDRSFLLRGSDLAVAERWLDDQGAHAERPTADQVAYITAGRRAAARRQRTLLAGVGLALIVTTALAIIALALRATAVDNERTARARAAAAEAIASLGRDPEESLRRALDAVAIRAGEPEAVFALRRAVASVGWTKLLRPARAGLGAPPLLDVDVSADGRYVATAADDGTAAVWDVRSGRAVGLVGHAAAVSAVTFSPDGRRVLTASADGTARTWDVDGRAVHVMRAGAGAGAGSGAVALAAYDARGERIVTANGRGAQVWDAATGRRLVALRASGDLARTIRLSPDGRVVLAPRRDGRDLWLWDVPTGRHVATLPGRGGAQLRLALFSGDGRRIVTLDTAGEATVWQRAPVERRARFRARHPAVNDVDFSRDGRRVVTAGSDGTAEVQSAASGRRIALLRNGTSVASAQFDRSGRYVVTGGDDGVARVWDVRAARATGVLRGHTAAIHVARFSPDAAAVVTASDDGSARVWPAAPPAPSDRAWRVADSTTFAPDSRHVLVVSGERRGVWDLATGAVVALRGGGPVTDPPAWPCGHAAGCAPWSPDGRLVAGATARGRAVIWDVRSGSVQRRLGPAEGGAIGAAFSPDGRRVVVVDGERASARVWDVASGRPLASVPARGADPLQSAQFAGDSRRVLTVDAAGVAQLSDLATGKSVRLPGSTRPPAVAVSPDGRRVAVGTSDGELRVFDDPARRPRIRRATSSEPVNSLAFDRSGRWIATGGQKGTTRVWNARTLEPVTLQGPGGAVASATFSRDGGLVLDTSGSRVRLWDRALRRPVLERKLASDAVAELSPDDRTLVLSDGRLEARRCEACAPLDALVRRARSLLPAS